MKHWNWECISSSYVITSRTRWSHRRRHQIAIDVDIMKIKINAIQIYFFAYFLQIYIIQFVYVRWIYSCKPMYYAGHSHSIFNARIVMRTVCCKNMTNAPNAKLLSLFRHVKIIIHSFSWQFVSFLLFCLVYLLILFMSSRKSFQKTKNYYVKH